MSIRVLVTGAGGPSAVSFLRAVSSDVSLELFAADIDPYAAGLHLVPRERRVLLRRGDDPRFVEHLAEVCESRGIRVLVPTVDSELLPIAREESLFARRGTAVLSPSRETLELCLDKMRVVRACEGSCPVPKTALFGEGFDAEAFGVPLVLKPRSGSGGRDIVIVKRRDDLATKARSEATLAQEYLPGDEYSIDVLASRTGKVLAAVPRVRLKTDSGVAVTARTVRDAELEAIGADVARAIALSGVANVQVKRDALGVPRLLEVNARFPGAMPLTVAAGVDMPRIAIDDLLGRSIPDERLPFAETAMVRTYQEHFVPTSDLGDLEAAKRELSRR